MFTEKYLPVLLETQASALRYEVLQCYRFHAESLGLEINLTSARGTRPPIPSPEGASLLLSFFVSCSPAFG